MSKHFSNPQAFAAANKTREYTGHPELGRDVDPDTWLTPRYILDPLGVFDLDPCAAAESPGWVSRNYFTKAEDGLAREWSGRVFMNPPFSNTVPWLKRASEHRNGITLVPASVESQAWREFVWTRAACVLLLHGRTRFCNPDGSSTTGRPLRSVALIAWTALDQQALELSPFAGVLLPQWFQR
jgi:hypothetical protein